MDDKEDRQVTLFEIERTLFRKMTDAIYEYNEFVKKNNQDLPMVGSMVADLRWIRQ